MRNSEVAVFRANPGGERSLPLSEWVTDIATVTASTFAPTKELNGAARVLTDGTGVAVSLPANLPEGYSICLIQGGAGQITFSAGSGATVNQADGYTKSRTQYAAVTALVMSNPTGAAGVWLLLGDMGA